MTSFITPQALRPGDKVAAISLSSGLAAAIPHRYQTGKAQLERTFGLEVVETPNALRDDEWLRANPEARADDLHWALTAPDVRGIVSVIGGDDSVRVLPHVDIALIRRHPKVFLGFSDATTVHAAYQLAGVKSFYGPAVMTDLAENGGIHPYTERAVHETLFQPVWSLTPVREWTDERLDWNDPALHSVRRRYRLGRGWSWLQGYRPAAGRLIGGNAETLEALKGTRWWPPASHWDGAVLALETSEEVPAPRWIGHWLRNYGAQGILEHLSALLIARPQGYTPVMNAELHATVTSVLAEFGRGDLPVVADMDFGHTSPQMVLPLGNLIRVDPHTRRVHMLEDSVDAAPEPCELVLA